MQERVQELHGTFELKSAPGQGTHIRICLPREEEHDSRSHH
jgi:signal transduction histidine kinase